MVYDEGLHDDDEADGPVYVSDVDVDNTWRKVRDALNKSKDAGLHASVATLVGIPVVRFETGSQLAHYCDVVIPGRKYEPDTVRCPHQITEGREYIARHTEYSGVSRTIKGRTFRVVKGPYPRSVGGGVAYWWVDVVTHQGNELPRPMSLVELGLMPYSDGSWYDGRWVAFSGSGPVCCCHCTKHGVLGKAGAAKA